MDPAPLVDWLLEQAMQNTALDTVICGLNERLVHAGVPAWRFSVAHPMLSPENFGVSWVWERGVGIRDVLRAPEPFWLDDRWMQSPWARLVIDRQRTMRCTPSPNHAFPLLRQLHAEGATDYVAFRVPTPMRITGVETRPGVPDGVTGSWTTDDPDGWSAEHLALLRGLEVPFAVVVKEAVGRDIVRELVQAYLGRDAGQRVLDGTIQRGGHAAIRAVIWFSDLRGSTPLAEALSPPDFLAALNAYYDCTAGSAVEHGGEILGFIGDASLAIFPIDDDPGAACARALAAARLATERVRVFNEEQTAAGAPTVGHGVGLHLGEVLYGNIGIPSRMAFTIIGSAANAAARVESMTRTLGESVLATEAVRRHLDIGWRDCGVHALRGVDAPIALFAPP